MKNENKQKINFKKAGSGFYIVLSLCLIAVGVAAWSAVSAFNNYNAEIPQLEYEQPDNSYNESAPLPDAPAQNEVENVEYEKPEPEPQPAPEPAPKIPTAEYFLLPAEGNIIKVFDNITLQYSSTLGDMRLHTGIDIAAPEGSIVTAAGDGTITEIYNDAAYGYIIIIDHGNNTVAKYCGLSEEISVKSGDTVLAGTEIGTLGSVPCESADESHLHFEIYENGECVSPLKKMGMEDE